MFGRNDRPRSLPSNQGFTLIEMIVSITIFAIIIVMAFDAMGNIGVARIRVSDKLDINKDLYYAVEKITALIKDGGGIDYEEYWNRKSVGTATMSGHYIAFSGFGNYEHDGNTATQAYGNDLYYCRSGNATGMGTNGCLTTTNNTLDTPTIWLMQRYGQYAFQFIDYNSNQNNDGGDEDGDGNIRGDDDDESLGAWPEAFTGGEAVRELYLIKTGDENVRTFFRWNIIQDPDAPSGVSCDFDTATGSGCLGNLQMLKLVGRDYGHLHDASNASSDGRFDGVMDTWECHLDYNCSGNLSLPLGHDSEWINVFPDYIHVKNVNFYLSPSKDHAHAWKEDSVNLSIHPYVRMNITLGFNWEKRKKIGAENPEVTIATTISLSK